MGACGIVCEFEILYKNMICCSISFVRYEKFLPRNMFYRGFFILFLSRCGVGEGRIWVNDELKDLARKANVFGDKKPDNFAVLSYVSELLSGSLKMILKADHAVQYLAAGNFDVCDPSGKWSLKNGRKSGSSPSSVNEKTATSGGSTSPVPFPSEADMSDDIDQLLTWIAGDNNSAIGC